MLVLTATAACLSVAFVDYVNHSSKVERVKFDVVRPPADLN